MRSLFILAVLAIAATGALLQATDKTATSYEGEISDSICARDGSHAEAMRMSKDMGETAASCTTACVYHAGAKFVLFDPERKKVYLLHPQEDASKFAGQKVRIVGTLRKKTLEIESISPR